MGNQANCIGILFVIFSYSLHSINSQRIPPNFQVVHFLDPSGPDTLYYGSWNSDQWVNWLRLKYEGEAELRRQNAGELETSLNKQELKGSWVNIIITVTEDDFLQTAYASDSVHAYTDPQRSDYFWSDFAFPVYVVIRSPNATVNITEEDATSNEEMQSGRRTLYGYNVYNCADKKMFVNAKLDVDTLQPIHYQTFFPKKVKNPKDKLRIPLSVCTKVGQKRGLLDEIRFQLGGNLQL